MASSSNPFPRLNLDILKQYANRWAEQYPSAQIERIVLYDYGELVRKKYPHQWQSEIKYAVVFHLPGPAPLLALHPPVYNYDSDRGSAKALMRDCHNGNCKGNARYPAFISASFETVYVQTPPDLYNDEAHSFKDEWLLTVRFNGDDRRYSIFADDMIEGIDTVLLLDEQKILADGLMKNTTGKPLAVAKEQDNESGKTPHEDITVAVTKAEHSNSFVFSGHYWEVYYNGKKTILKDLERMRYIAHLLEKPNKNFSPTELVTLVKGNTPEPNKELSGMSAERLGDDEGLSLVELQTVGLSAEDKNSFEKTAYDIWGKYKKKNSDTARADWEKLKEVFFNEYGIRCFERSNGLRFKVHTRLDGQDEKARLNVRKHIDRAIADIKKEIPNLGTYLEGTIKTGNKVCYSPGESASPWTIKR